MPRSLALVGTIALLLAACGGGGSSGDSGTPAGGGNGGNGNGGTSLPTLEQAIAAGSGAAFDAQPTGSGAAVGVALEGDGGLRLSRGGTAFLAFGPEEIVNEGGGFVVYQDAAANAVAGTSRPGATFSGRRLDYTAFGYWVTVDPARTGNGDVTATDAAAFFGGVRTPSNEVPTTGSAAYQGAAAGEDVQANGSLSALFGTFSATADFAAGTVTGTMDLRDQEDASWGTVQTGAMAITGGGFAGNAASSTNGHTGGASGRFFGPAAAEVGGAFSLTGPSTVKGSFAGAK